MIKKIGTFDHKKMLQEYETIPISYRQNDQFCIQGVMKNDDPLYGSRRISEMSHKEADFIYPLFNLPYTNSLLKEYGLVRTRIMNLPKKHCLSYHYDPTNRVHFPLITNEDVFYVVEDKICRMNEPGVVYKLEAVKKHTVVNASLKHRIHIVGVLL
jgi:hypothetical protein